MARANDFDVCLHLIEDHGFTADFFAALRWDPKTLFSCPWPNCGAPILSKQNEVLEHIIRRHFEMKIDKCQGMLAQEATVGVAATCVY